METTLCNNPSIASRNDSIRKLKSSLTLDLSTKESPLTFDSILSSPDVRMLKLATPELDRLLLQHQMVNTGRGGGGGGGGGGMLTGSQVWFPKTVTEEQEAYARGFVDALLELHNKREAAAAAAAAAAVGSSSDLLSCLTPKDNGPEVDPTGYDTSLDLSRTRFSSDATVSYSTGSASVSQAIQLPPEVGFPSAPVYDSLVREKQHRIDSSPSVSQPRRSSGSGIQWITEAVHLKSEKTPAKHNHPSRLKGAQYSSTTSPQWPHSTTTASVPLIGCLSDTPPISPIDMVQQEAIKLARKRARNRLAATRCRNRKLERIASLQEKVDQLKEQNVQLTNTASELRETITRMRHEIDTHIMNGCRLNITSQSFKFV